jgi:hypothetical protein
MSEKPTGPSRESVDNFFHLHELYTQTHSGEAMFCAALIDLELRKAILSKMIKLSKTKEADMFDAALGPLHELSSKIKVAYSLGLLSEKLEAELIIIKRIRDTFAHKPKKLTFFSPEIRRRIDELNFKGKATYPNIFLMRVEACLEQIIASAGGARNT